MQNRRYFLLALIFIGCSRPPKTVFVDLDLVPISKPKQAVTTDIRPDIQGSNSLGSKTLPGQPATQVENLRGDEKVAIRQEVEKQTDDAISTISARLQDYYSREIDDFYKIEFAKLAPLKQTLMADYLKAIRPIFEASAKKRGPVLTRLSFLTGFPPVKTLVPIEGENLSKSDVKRRTEIRNLQRSLNDIDLQYAKDIEKLDSNNSAQIEAEFKNLQTRLEAKQKEIDDRARDEAAKLVKRFSSSLSERIFSRYTFQLKEIPTKTVNFPKIDAQPGVPRVTFDGAQSNQNEKAELVQELATFLSLNHYQRVPSPEGAMDATKEFIEWRTNLKSGHWESWQKSSTQK